MELGSQLRVEVFGNGGWWKDSIGRSGQVAVGQARRGPLAAVAMVANHFGMDGWELIDVMSHARGGYYLSFELAYVMEDEDDEQADLTGSE